MAKSMYLLKLLPLAVLLLYSSAGGYAVTGKRLLVRSIYRGEVGVREQSGHNDGPRIKAYLGYTGLKEGAPYCAAFVCWSLGRAGIVNPRSAWSPGLFPASKVIWERNRHIPNVSLPEVFAPGNVFGIWFNDKGRVAHAGFTDGLQGQWAITVEANTNVAGSREGDGVYRKRRLISSVYQVADWVDEVGSFQLRLNVTTEEVRM